MPIPNVPEKHTSEPLIRAEDMLALKKRQGKFPSCAPPQGVIFCMRSDIPRRLRWQIPLKKVGRTLGDISLFRSTKGRVGVLTDFGIGAPALVAFAEEMIAWGVRRFVLLSWGGSLQSSLKAGDVILAEKAIRDEGVSHHYLPPERYIHADAPQLVAVKSCLSAQKISFMIGSTWTTDAPYQETTAEVVAYQNEGVQVVEMETAALYALARSKNVAVTSIVIAADDLSAQKWQPPKDFQAIDRSFEVCYRAAIQALNGDSCN